jgi:hypothetical protein
MSFLSELAEEIVTGVQNGERWDDEWIMLLPAITAGVLYEILLPRTGNERS